MVTREARQLCCGVTVGGGERALPVCDAKSSHVAILPPVRRRRRTTLVGSRPVHLSEGPLNCVVRPCATYARRHRQCARAYPLERSESQRQGLLSSTETSAHPRSCRSPCSGRGPTKDFLAHKGSIP